MPQKELHLKKAADNESLASHLDLSASSGPNWAITMTFYAAVHYVEAYFFTQGRDYQLHIERDSAIKRDKQIGTIWRLYQRLKDASINARYERAFFTDRQFASLRPNLDQIKSVIMPLL